MTDELHPTIDGKPLVEEDPNKGIKLDAHGDPVRQGTRMTEQDSLERVIEGMKIAADAAMHLAKEEGTDTWVAIALCLDQVRKGCVQQAGMAHTAEKKTEKLRGDPMPWRKARERFRDGLVQAAGGARQVATCHRGDFWWSRIATEIENLEAKIRNPKLAPAALRRGLILPPGYHS